MINISPMEEFYLKEICKGKYLKEIAEENGVKENSIGVAMCELKKRVKLRKLQLILTFLRNDYKVVYNGVRFKKYDEVMASQEAAQLKKIGYTDREIIRELQGRAE